MTSHTSVPLRQSHGLQDARLIAAPTFRDERGALGVVQAREIPFAIERLYWLYDVPPDRHRGDHGHRSLQQVLIAMAGSFSVVLHDGVDSRTWRLTDRTVGLYIPPMMWRRLEQFSADGVCLVLASEAYDPADYFPDFDLFVEAARQAREGERPRLMQFLDVGFTYRALKSELDAAVGRVMASGWYVQGGELAAFEAAFARYTGAGACVGVGNGLDALTLTLRAIGCGPGDEVIVPAHTFIATWLAVSATGATVVPVDADPGSMNIGLAATMDRVSPRTRAIIPVHLYGLPVDVEELRRRIGPGAPFILEDAAQAHGARVRGAPVGSLDAAGFSFYPAKTLGAFGDGGAVTTRDPELAQAIRRLGNYGSSEKYRHEEVGVNSRLDELQAACLTVKLTTLDAWNARRSQIAARYLDALSGLDGLELPAVAPVLESAWHLFVVRVDAPEDLAGALARHGVPTQRHYPIPPHLSGAYAGLFEPGAFPVTEAICRGCLSLPIGPHLSDAEVDQVCDAVRVCVSR